MTSLVIAGNSLRRYLRDRTALFFVVALPVLVIVVIGMTVRGFDQLKVAVVSERSGPLGRSLATAIDRSPALKASPARDLDAARLAVRRGEVEAAVVVPPGTDQALRAGRTVHVVVYADLTSSTRQAARSAVASVVDHESGIVQAARFADGHGTGGFAVDLRRAQAGSGAVAARVRATTVDHGGSFLPEGFADSAPTMLVLFVFINAVAAGGAMIETRRLGIYQRISAAPLHPRSIILGETLCYLALAVLQSALIVVVGAVAFGVDWGDPLAVVALLVVWAVVGTGAGVLSGTLFRTAEQAAAIGPPIGIALGMLGGCMWPLEIVPSAMRLAGHLVPHAWAIDAWIGILSRHGDLATIARPLGVLLAYGAALIAVATWRLRAVVAGR